MPTALRGITWEHPRGHDSLRALTAGWRAAHPELGVEWSARSLADFGDAPLERLADSYDLLVIDHPHVPHAAEHGLLLALDGTGHDGELTVLSRQSVGRSHASYQHDGRQWALAVDAAAQVAAYRPDLLGCPPGSWDEVFELAAAGRVLWPGRPTDAIASFLTLAANRGAVVGGPDEFVAEDVGGVVLEHLRRLTASVPEECLDHDPIAVAERLATGEEWCYAPLVYGYSNYSRSGFRSVPVAYTDLPAGPRGVSGSCLGGAGIAVSARTGHPVEAVEYAFWVASAEVQRGPYYRGGGQPANAKAWEDDEVNADSLDFFRATRATLEGAALRPRDPGWPWFQTRAGLLLNSALRGEIEDERCLAELARQYARRHAAVAAGE